METNVTVSGKNAWYFILNDDLIVQGRRLNYIDDDNNSYVCVISREMVDTFFFGVDPIGETLYISGLEVFIFPYTTVMIFKN